MGDPSLPSSQTQLRSVTESHRVLFESIPCVSDHQAAWLLLLYCAGTRVKCLLRAVPPNATEEHAVEHDSAMRRCLCRLLESDIPDAAWEVANLPFSIRVLGLRNSSSSLLGQLGGLSPHRALASPCSWRPDRRCHGATLASICTQP